jgi:hypothetical protein
MEVLESIPVKLNAREVRKRLRMNKDRHWQHVQELVEKAEPLITARAVYKAGYIDAKHDDAVTVDGVQLRSRVLRKNLDKVERVFPYVLTIGAKLEESARAQQDMLDRYYLDTIGNVALVEVRTYLEDLLRSRYGLGGASYMSPGSLEDWPIEEQAPLFGILGDVDRAIGVKLSDSLLMVPNKSLSGMYFPTEVRFVNCQLCPRENCPSRKAKYSKRKAEDYGVLK